MPDELEDTIKNRRLNDIDKQIKKIELLINNDFRKEYPELTDELEGYLEILKDPNLSMDEKKNTVLIVENRKLELFMEKDDKGGMKL